MSDLLKRRFVRRSEIELQGELYEATKEIERLRAALRAILADVDYYNECVREYCPDMDPLDWDSIKPAKEALGDE